MVEIGNFNNNVLLNPNKTIEVIILHNDKRSLILKPSKKKIIGVVLIKKV